LIRYSVLNPMYSFIVFRIHMSTTLFTCKHRRYTWISSIHSIKFPYNGVWNLFFCITKQAYIRDGCLWFGWSRFLFLFAWFADWRNSESSFLDMLLYVYIKRPLWSVYHFLYRLHPYIHNTIHNEDKSSDPFDHF